MTSLQVEIRQDSGKGVARKLRATGKVPGVVYGPESDPVSVAIDPRALTDIFQETRNRNTIVELQMDGKTVPCLVREVQRHPVSRDLLHVDFYRLADDRQVAVDVPLVPIGRPKGAVLGGRLRLIRRTLTALCLPKDIPASFEIDATPLNIGDMVRSSEINLPEGVKLKLESDINVLACYGKRKALDLPEVGEGEEAEGEEAEGEEAEGGADEGGE